MPILALALAALHAAPHASAATRVAEYEVKAAFLFNFARFVEWPGSALGRPSDPFVVGVLGDDPFGPALDQAFTGKRVHDRPVVVLRWPDAERARPDLRRCHLLFVCASEREALTPLLDALGQAPVLTVGDHEGCARRGLAIELYPDNERIRFEINAGAARQARLRVSSKLLDLARRTPLAGR